MTTTDSTKRQMVPLVTSEVTGPLGVAHLPRLWTKLTLSSAGLLPEDYDACGPGFDQMTLDAMHLDRDETINFVRSKKPTYVQFEQWVVERNDGRIDPERIKAHNQAVHGYNHGDELGSSIRSTCGLNDKSIKDAVTLNKLEDLDAFHRHVTA